MGRAEGRPRDHGLPARARRRHRTRGTDLQDLRQQRRRGHDTRPLLPRTRHPRDRLQGRRRHRDKARHREDDNEPPARGHQLRPGRGEEGRPLRTAGRQAPAAGRVTARGSKPPGADRTRAGAGRRRRRSRDRPRHAVRLPREATPRRAQDRQAARRAEHGQAPVAAHRPGTRAPARREKDRPVARARPGPGARPGADVESDDHHRGTRRRQDHAARRHPAHPDGEKRQAQALRADRPRRPQDERRNRHRGPHDPPPARGRPGDLQLQARRGQPDQLRPAGARRGVDGRRHAGLRGPRRAGPARSGPRRADDDQGVRRRRADRRERILGERAAGGAGAGRRPSGRAGLAAARLPGPDGSQALHRHDLPLPVAPGRPADAVLQPALRGRSRQPGGVERQGRPAVVERARGERDQHAGDGVLRGDHAVLRRAPDAGHDRDRGRQPAGPEARLPRPGRRQPPSAQGGGEAGRGFRQRHPDDRDAEGRRNRGRLLRTLGGDARQWRWTRSSAWRSSP